MSPILPIGYNGADGFKLYLFQCDLGRLMLKVNVILKASVYGSPVNCSFISLYAIFLSFADGSYTNPLANL